MSRKIAIYLRSSKDRHDLSIDAQRRTLHEYARDNSMLPVAEFKDAVESGSDANRPGFQELLSALKQPRDWDAVLALDTSRIARRRQLALIFEHEAERAGVEVLYKSIPDTDPITAMLLRSVLQAMDEWHSLTSKAKGLAGMAESVRQGWRAGGPAPRGYRLKHEATHIMREGQPVVRSRLEPDPECSDAIQLYLKMRAKGKSRTVASAASGVDKSLNDLEWNALTYAGHTVWNVAEERKGNGYVTGKKRKPRSEWLITRNTHPSFITDEEAEALLEQLEKQSSNRNRATDRVYLLSGLLFAPDGTPFSGETIRDQRSYRLKKKRRISAKALETSVLDRVFADLAKPDIASALAEQMRAGHQEPVGDIEKMQKQVKTLDLKIDRIIRLIAEDEEASSAYRRTVSQLEVERMALVEEIDEARARQDETQFTQNLTADDVQHALNALGEDIKAGLEDNDLREMRRALSMLIERIEYDLDERKAHIFYEVNTGINLALPRLSDFAPVLQWDTYVTVPKRIS